jgi:hypothetical protein
MSDIGSQQEIDAAVGVNPGMASGVGTPREIMTPPAEQFGAYRQAEPGAFQYIQEGVGAVGMGVRSRTGGGAPVQSGAMSRLLYYGQNLVNERGQIERKPYDATKEAYAELAKLNPTDRAALQTELYQRKFYRSKSRPSTTGFNPADVDAMKELLLASNEYGYNWKTSLNFIRQEYPASGSGRKGPSKMDTRKSLDEKAVEALGRKFTDAEVESLITQVQQKSVAGESGSLSTISENVVAGAATGEQQAYRFAQVADLFNEMLRTG